MDAPLALVGLALLTVHAAVPLGYYVLMMARLRHDNQQWESSRDPAGEANSSPRVTVIVPTFNERDNIVEKLNNIAEEAKDVGGVEVLVVDGNSSDGTADAAESWRGPPWVTVKVIREKARLGKHVAENEGLRLASGDIVVFTDADCLWAPGSLKRAVEALKARDVGLVTCVKSPASRALHERSYRDLYNLIRIGESTAHSTPIAHGELLAVRKEVLEQLGGLRPGADDSDLAHRIAMMGLRAVALPDVKCIEKVPRGTGYLEWRLRRAQHLVMHFLRSVRDLPRAPRGYRAVLMVEAYLHLVNEWLALAALALLMIAAAMGQPLALALVMVLLIALAASSQARAWAVSQAFLVAGAVRNLFTREEVWRKVSK